MHAPTSRSEWRSLSCEMLSDTFCMLVTFFCDQGGRTPSAVHQTVWLSSAYVTDDETYMTHCTAEQWGVLPKLLLVIEMGQERSLQK